MKDEEIIGIWTKRFVPSGPVNANAGYNKGTTTTAANEPPALAKFSEFSITKFFNHKITVVA